MRTDTRQKKPTSFARPARAREPMRARKRQARLQGLGRDLTQMAPAEARHDHGVKCNIQEKNAERKIDAALLKLG
jgi:hypothetical protein